jgi:hypothetical protein
MFRLKGGAQKVAKWQKLILAGRSEVYRESIDIYRIGKSFWRID